MSDEPPDPGPLRPLTRQVTQLLIEGHDIGSIGRRLALHGNTISDILDDLQTSLGASSVIQAVALAVADRHVRVPRDERGRFTSVQEDRCGEWRIGFLSEDGPHWHPGRFAYARQAMAALACLADRGYGPIYLLTTETIT